MRSLRVMWIMLHGRAMGERRGRKLKHFRQGIGLEFHGCQDEVVQQSQWEHQVLISRTMVARTGMRLITARSMLSSALARAPAGLPAPVDEWLG